MNNKTNSHPAPSQNTELRRRHTRALCFSAVVMFGLIVLSRSFSALRSVSATDIAYPAWVEVLSSYLTETFGSLRMTCIFVLISLTAFYSPAKMVRTGLFCALFSFSDYAARFLIDLMNSSISGYEPLAGLLNLANFVLECVFIVISASLAKIFFMKNKSAQETLARKKYSPARAWTYSVLIFAAANLLLEIYYLADFLITYVNITNTEIASIVGSFLRIIVIYAGIPLIAGNFFQSAAEKILKAGKPAEE